MCRIPILLRTICKRDGCRCSCGLTPNDLTHSLSYARIVHAHRYKRIHKWFLDTFPGADHQLNLDSAIPASTAWYFSVSGPVRPQPGVACVRLIIHRALLVGLQYCVRETVPDDADLVLLELDINHHDPFPESLEATEALFRTLLALPKQPALIYISVFGLILSVWHGLGGVLPRDTLTHIDMDIVIIYPPART